MPATGTRYLDVIVSPSSEFAELLDNLEKAKNNPKKRKVAQNRVDIAWAVVNGLEPPERIEEDEDGTQPKQQQNGKNRANRRSA